MDIRPGFVEGKQTCGTTAVSELAYPAAKGYIWSKRLGSRNDSLADKRCAAEVAQRPTEAEQHAQQQQ